MSRPRNAGQDRSRGRYRMPASLLAGLLAAGALAGCGSPAPELGPSAARQLQSHVLAVSEAAAANDPAASLQHLDELLPGVLVFGLARQPEQRRIRNQTRVITSDPFDELR
mgnify:CR=1 FL=1